MVVPFDKREGKIWMNGELLPWQSAQTHVLTHGLHYGSSVFEGNRAYQGKIFKLREHSERLIRSAELLDMKVPYTAEQIDQACEEVLQVNGIVNGYLRPMAWRGSEMMAISAQDTTTHVAIAAWEWPSYFSPEDRLKGIALGWAKYKRPSPETEPVHAKAAGLYMICTISKHLAEKEGYNDALMLDWRGRIAEATGANVFLVQNGELHTPDPDCFLNGLTRQSIITLAKRRGIKVVERAIFPEELEKTQEVFLTGTAAEVTPVRQVGTHHFSVGPVTRALLEDYENWVNGRLDVEGAAS